MNLYIAGIKMNEELRKLPPKAACFELVKIFPKIIADAQWAFDKNVIIIITLQEYALTLRAINDSTKKTLLNCLQNAISQYPNVILIPGSLATYQPFVNAPHKIDKLKQNYKIATEQGLLEGDTHFNNEYNQYTNKITQPIYDISYFENCTYILTHNNKIKHKKGYPWKERDQLFGIMKNQSIFYIGADQSIKTVALQNETVDINLLVCREHHYEDDAFKKRARQPLIEVIISDWTNINTNNLHGALNISMDSKFGLTVYQNKSHDRAKLIDNIKAMEYTKKMTGEPSDEKRIYPLQLKNNKQNNIKTKHKHA